MILCRNRFTNCLPEVKPDQLVKKKVIWNTSTISGMFHVILGWEINLFLSWFYIYFLGSKKVFTCKIFFISFFLGSIIYACKIFGPYFNFSLGYRLKKGLQLPNFAISGPMVLTKLLFDTQKMIQGSWNFFWASPRVP